LATQKLPSAIPARLIPQQVRSSAPPVKRIVDTPNRLMTPPVTKLGALHADDVPLDHKGRVDEAEAQSIIAIGVAVTRQKPGTSRAKSIPATTAPDAPPEPRRAGRSAPSAAPPAGRQCLVGGQHVTDDRRRRHQHAHAGHRQRLAAGKQQDGFALTLNDHQKCCQPALATGTSRPAASTIRTPPLASISPISVIGKPRPRERLAISSSASGGAANKSS